MTEHQGPRLWDSDLNLAKDLNRLPEWERDRVIGEVRGAYIYARSAAQRAYKRAAEEKITDAQFETLWWIGALDDFMDTIFLEGWREYKDQQPWKDLIHGTLWARNLTLHDPLGLIQLHDRNGLVDGEWRVLRNPVWAKRTTVLLSVSGKENQKFAAAYDRALAGRVYLETLHEAIEALRHTHVNDVYEHQPRPV